MLSRRRLLLATGIAASFPGVAAGQPATSTIPEGQRLAYREGRYLPWYMEVKAGADRFPLADMAAWLGDHATALRQEGRPSPSAPLPSSARAEDALKRIVGAAEGRRVVMLNEAHFASHNRQFLAQLARALRPLGFTHLACETFTNPGLTRAPNVRDFRPGAPWNPGYGTYTRDPVLTEAVREACELGYRLVPYEARAGQMGPRDAAPAERIALREQAQAENLIAGVLDPEPQARVLVYVGFAHLNEAPTPRGDRWFATRLKALTGLDPLTIEQSFTGSVAPYAADGPLTRQVLERFSPRRPIVVEAGGAPVGLGGYSADLAVYHPALPKVEGRPGWLAADPKRRRLRVRLPHSRTTGEPVLLQAVHAEDGDVATPADQYLLPEAVEAGVLWLRRGRYRLRLETLQGFTTIGEATV